MPVQSPEIIVEKQLAAYNRGDVDEFAACYSDDVEIWRDGMLVLRGLPALREQYSTLFRKHPALSAIVAQRLVGRSLVVDEELVTGRGEGPELRAIAVFRVKFGRIRQAWFHTDEAE